MAQCRGTFLKMEEWSINSTVIKGIISMALLSFIVTKDSGMTLHQAVNQMVSISKLYCFSILNVNTKTNSARILCRLGKDANGASCTSL